MSAVGDVYGRDLEGSDVGIVYEIILTGNDHELLSTVLIDEAEFISKLPCREALSYDFSDPRISGPKGP